MTAMVMFCAVVAWTVSAVDEPVGAAVEPADVPAVLEPAVPLDALEELLAGLLEAGLTTLLSLLHALARSPKAASDARITRDFFIVVIPPVWN